LKEAFHFECGKVTTVEGGTESVQKCFDFVVRVRTLHQNGKVVTALGKRCDEGNVCVTLTGKGGYGICLRQAVT